MIVLITSHAYTHYCTSFDSTCWSTCWYIIWPSLSVLSRYHYPSDCSILTYLVCVHWWYIWDLFDWVLHDYSSSAWLHVACTCGPHFYPLTSKSLGFGHSFHLGSHYCKCETFCVLVLWPSQRLGVGSSDGLYRCTGAFWRRATLWCRLESDHWRPV